MVPPLIALGLPDRVQYTPTRHPLTRDWQYTCGRPGIPIGIVIDGTTKADGSCAKATVEGKAPDGSLLSDLQRNPLRG